MKRCYGRQRRWISVMVRIDVTDAFGCRSLLIMQPPEVILEMARCKVDYILLAAAISEVLSCTFIGIPSLRSSYSILFHYGPFGGGRDSLVLGRSCGIIRRKAIRKPCGSKTKPRKERHCGAASQQPIPAGPCHIVVEVDNHPRIIDFLQKRGRSTSRSHGKIEKGQAFLTFRTKMTMPCQE